MHLRIVQLLWILLFTILFCGCATRVVITKKYIRRNESFDYGLRVHKLKVDSFYADGKPAIYTVDSVFQLKNLQSLSDAETLILLNDEKMRRYAWLKNIRDSLGRKEMMRELPADTIYHPVGSRAYLPAGLRYQNQWHEAMHEMEQIRWYGIKIKKKKIIHFSKPNKYYRWYAWNIKLPQDETRISKLRLIPGQWYKTFMQCSLGFASHGTCIFYFTSNKKGRIIIKRTDEPNLGPF